MPVFGSFETVREVSRVGLGAVFVARRAGTTDERYAVKIFEPPAYMVDEEQIERDSKLFLEAADVQRSAAGAGSSWAMVYESGLMEGGAWYATDLYDRSVEKLVLYRSELEPRDLVRLVDSVLNGLFELRGVLGRAHGNLKDTNVLISGKGDLAAARVMLCDPEASERLKGDETRKDLRDLGDLLHRLVLHRAVRGPAGWPVQSSSEWHRLGRVGEGWLKLMNQLLDPTDEKLTLDDVASLVPGGTVRPGSSTTAIPAPTMRVGKDPTKSRPASSPKSDPAPIAPVVTPVTPAPPAAAPVEKAPIEKTPIEKTAEPPISASPINTPPISVRPASAPARPAPPTPATPAPMGAGSDVTQELDGSGVPGSGAGSRPGTGLGSGMGSGPGSAAGARGAMPGGQGGVGAGSAVERSRPASLSNVGRVSSASVPGDMPKTFDQLPERSAPKKSGVGKWIGIGAGVIAVVAVAGVLIANSSKDKKGPGPLALENHPNDTGPKVEPTADPPKGAQPNLDPPKSDPPKETNGGTPSTGDKDEASKKKEAAAKEEADRIAREEAAKDAAEKKAREDAAKETAAKEAAAKEAAAKDAAAKEAAAKDAADKKAKEDAKTEANRKAAEDAANAAAGAKAQKVAATSGVIKGIAARLAAGLGLKDLPSDGGDSIAELLPKVDTSVEKDVTDADAALKDAITRARGLEKISTMTDVAAAKLATDEAAKGHASETIMAGEHALSRLADPKAGDLSALDAGGTFVDGIKAAAAKLPASARRDKLVADATARAKRMYLTSFAAVKVDDPQALVPAAAMSSRFGVTPEELPTKARLNLLVLVLKDEIAKAPGDDAAANAAVAKFKKTAGLLGAEAAPSVSAMVASLDAALQAPSTPEKPALNFATVGPGLKGWANKPGSDGMSVVYTSPSGQSVEFISVGSAYVSATEATVGLFHDVATVDVDGKTPVESLVKAGARTGKGPYAWEWASNNADIRPTQARAPDSPDPSGWIEPGTAMVNAKIKAYPKTIDGPTWAHPMQQLTAAAADRAARAMGCRLPTPAEWTSAAEMSGRADPAVANLRDAAWRATKDYVDQVRDKTIGPEKYSWPDDGVFGLVGNQETMFKARAAVDSDDGFVWFRPVPPPDGKFHDLVGNVAEWVMDSGGVRKAQVIGASALSPPGVDPKKAQSATRPDINAYADVGFRLAFDATGGAPVVEPLATRVKKAADAIALLK